MRGNNIVVSSDPKGKYLEGYLVDGITPKPGQILQIDYTASLRNGRHGLKLYAPGTNGHRPVGPYMVLLPDFLGGKTAEDAFPGSVKAQVQVYIPQAGDELNLLIKDVAGTGDAHTIGEKLIVENASGKLIATAGSPQSEPAVLLESLAALTADQLAWCIWTGY